MKFSVLIAGLGLMAGWCGGVKASEVLGFGEKSKGGAGGRVLMVTRRDDDREHPATGTLRWALKQKGPRVVKFAVSGDIVLKDRIIVREPYLTVDGSDAPGDGVCIREGSLMFRDTHDVTVRNVRIRLGEAPAKKRRRDLHEKRPPHSAGLDCVSLDDSSRIVFDHCSLSWSCDEIFGITHCREVTIQWCILSEPLANPKLHPYGDNHAFPINASASTLTVHHCLLAHYVMRGPQFEANDLRSEDGYAVQMEAVNNVMFDYQRSGSRYGCGVEKDNGTAAGKVFRFQFLNNLYVTDAAGKLPIEAITKHGVIPGVKVYETGNWREVVERSEPHGKMTVRMENMQEPYWQKKEETAAVRAQVSERKLFETSATRKVESVRSLEERVLNEAGCYDGERRDAVDRRAVADVRGLRFGRVRHEGPGFWSWLKGW